MGSIPLPALSAAPPANPLDQFSKVLQLKSLLAEQQTRQLQQTGMEQENQQRELELQDAKNMRTLAPQFLKKKASGQPTGFDSDGYYGALMGAGVSPAKIAAMQKAQNDAVLSKAQAGTAALKLEDDRNDQAFQIGEGVRALTDPTQKQAAYQAAVPKLAALGVDTSKFGPQYPGDDAIRTWEVGLGVHKQIIGDAQEQAKTRESTAKAALDELNAKTKEKFLSLTPDDVAKLVDSVTPAGSPLNLRTRSQALFQLQKGDQDGFNGVIKQAAEQVGAVEKDIQVATNPAIQRGKEQVAAAEGAARASTEINTKRQETSDSQYQTAIGADQRLSRMETSYTDAVKNHNQQAMLALLTDHIGMTLGLQKGARITKDILNEAANSQPWLASVAAKFDSEGYLSGVNLSPGQMKQMLDLGYSARENAWDTARSTSQLYGVNPPPNANTIYGKRDPNARVYNQAETRTYQGHTYTKQADGSWKLTQ